MLKILFAFVFLFFPFFLQAQDYQPSPVTQKRLQSLMGAMQQQSFLEVIRLLDEDKFQEARQVLSARINALLNAQQNNWQVYGDEPKLLDCLFQSYLINIYLDDIKAAENDSDIFARFDQANGSMLKKRIPEFIQEAKNEP